MHSSSFKHLLLFTLVLLQFPLFGQGIRGTIKSRSGEPLPFASVYITNLNNGSSSNATGQYEIRLPAGDHTVLVKYIGYEAQQVQVEIKEDWVERNFSLGEQSFALKEVQVKGKGEDPAYTIMRKAIAKKKYHLLQYDSYKMKVYVKGTGELTNAPFFLKKKLKEEGVKLNEAYTLESVSEIKFSQPNKLEEKVISIRTSGDNKGSISPMSFVNESFYKDKVVDMISPLSKSAFAYYRFQYEGSFREGDIDVNKIKVTPRSRGDNVFEGYIYIIENYWAIHSLDLQTSMMGFPIKVKQNFAEVAPAVWMPTTHQYTFSGKVMGFAGEFKYLASCSDYQVVLNKKLVAPKEIIDEKAEEVPAAVAAIKPPKNNNDLEMLANQDKLTRKQFRQLILAQEKEALKEQKQPEVVSERRYTVDKLATKRDSAYWDSVRPVPLSTKELKGYQRDDSLAQVKSAELTGKDSTKVIKKKKFNPLDVVTGGNYRLSPRTRLNIEPTFANVYYNTVEGYNVNLTGRLRHQYDSLRRTFEVAPTFRYGFASDDFYAKARVSHQVRRAGKSHLVYLDGGKFVEQYNDENPIHPHINTLSTLLFRRNYMKIYEKTFAQAGYEYKPSVWLKVSGQLEWAQRNQLYNTTGHSYFYTDAKRAFTPSTPDNIELEDTGFPEHEALVLEANVSYRPLQRYRMYNGRKIPLLEKSPELLLQYRKGIAGILGSDVDFDQLQLGINHGFAIGVRGRLQFELRGGTFLNNRSLYFMDYQHFDGNRTILSSLKPAGAFRLLDYYQYSTNNSYFSGHTHFQFRKFLLTHIPEVRFAGLKENVFFNYLKTQQSPHYYEVGYSLDNVFRVLRIEAAASFSDRNFQELGFRIGIATIFKISTN
ncbi:membrane receptor RagA [Pontibacter sp. HJ8]